MDYIVLSIPVFFFLIGVELLISKLKNSRLYRFSDAVSNISCGIAQQVSGVFLKTVLIVGYVYLYEHFRILEIQHSWYAYVLLFIGIDFCYYWFHRMAHEISLFWGTHIVHHQSEDYNFSVALRQSALQAFVSTIFYLPLALIGFHPVAFLTLSSLQTLYQFWIHTKTINKLPYWIEYVFNTPSHHRVHHGRNPKYIDKNHGGTLIIWDRLFGTFQAEEEEVIYGVTKPLRSWNPVWANFDYYSDLSRDFRQMQSWKDRLLLLFHKPGWKPEYLGGPEQVKQPTVKINYDPKVSARMAAHVFFQYVILLGITSWFLFNLDSLNVWTQMIYTAWIFLGIVNLGWILEGRQRGFTLEWLRLLIYLTFLWLPPVRDIQGAIAIVTAVIAVSLTVFYWASRQKNTFSGTISGTNTL